MNINVLCEWNIPQLILRESGLGTMLMVMVCRQWSLSLGTLFTLSSFYQKPLFVPYTTVFSLYHCCGRTIHHTSVCSPLFLFGEDDDVSSRGKSSVRQQNNALFPPVRHNQRIRNFEFSSRLPRSRLLLRSAAGRQTKQNTQNNNTSTIDWLRRKDNLCRP